MNLEGELREALRREPAPTDFTAKVLARVAVKKQRRVLALAMAAGLIAAAFIPPAISVYHRRQQAQEARRELLIALSITRTKLLQTQARLERAALRSTQGHTP